MTNRMLNSITFLRCVIIFILIALIFITLFISKVNFEGNDFHKEEYIIKSGDSLWSIGKKCIRESVDIREWIYEVKKLNNIDDNIYAGQVILVYVLNK